MDGEELYIPPGWDEWDVGGKGYAGYDYALNENGRYRYYGTTRRTTSPTSWPQSGSTRSIG